MENTLSSVMLNYECITWYNEADYHKNISHHKSLLQMK